MTLRSLMLGAFIIALGAMFAAPVARASDENSVADAAKQKTSEKKAKRVITDDDMPSTSAAATESDAGQSGTASESTADGSESTKTKPSAAANAAELQQELESLNHDDELLRKKLGQLQEKADAATDPFRKKIYEDAIEHQQIMLDDFQKRRKDLETRIAEAKARKKSKS